MRKKQPQPSGVAQAIQDAGPVGCEFITDEVAVMLARVAIGALREPTPAMINAAEKSDHEPLAASYADLWRVMIDAALAEVPDA